MNNNINQFIEDFKESSIYHSIINDNSAEVIMLWLTGSALLTPDSTTNDYDICVLVKNKPQESEQTLWKIYGRPGSYFAYYKAQNKVAQWIYNDIADITSITSTPLDNIGWAQFSQIKEEYVIYRNPKYNAFIEALFEIRREISDYALYLFAKSATQHFKECMITDDLRTFRRNFEKPAKILGHICWAADMLQGNTPDDEKIETIKHNLLENVPENCYEYILKSAAYLETYLQQLETEFPQKPNLVQLLEECIHVSN